jgi:hypothetical protein
MYIIMYIPGNRGFEWTLKIRRGVREFRGMIVAHRCRSNAPAPPKRVRRALVPPVLLRRGLPGDRQATRRHRLRAGAPTELRRRCADLVLRGRRHSSLVSPRAIAQHSSPWLARIDRQLPTCAMAEGSRAAQDSPTVGASPECRAASARAACGADPRRAALAASFAAGDCCLPAVLLRRRLPADRQAPSIIVFVLVHGQLPPA